MRFSSSAYRWCSTPSRGTPEEERNILNHGLNETVKEFSTIDEAFVIRGDGLIKAAGVYLKPNAPGVKLPWGLGTRHASAAGDVRVLRDGRIFTEVERLRSLVPRPPQTGSQ